MNFNFSRSLPALVAGLVLCCLVLVSCSQEEAPILLQEESPAYSRSSLYVTVRDGTSPCLEYLPSG